MVVYFIMDEQTKCASWEKLDPTKIVSFENIDDIPFYNLNIVLIDDFYDPANPKFVMNTIKNSVASNIRGQYPHYFIKSTGKQIKDECDRYFISNENGFTKVLNMSAYYDFEPFDCCVDYYKELWDKSEYCCKIGESDKLCLTNESVIFKYPFDPVDSSNKYASTLQFEFNLKTKKINTNETSRKRYDPFSKHNSNFSFKKHINSHYGHKLESQQYTKGNGPDETNSKSTILKFVSGHVKKRDYEKMQSKGCADNEIIIKSMFIEFLEETPIIFNILYYLYEITNNNKIHRLLSNLSMCYTNQKRTKDGTLTYKDKVICKFNYYPDPDHEIINGENEKDIVVSELINKIYLYLADNDDTNKIKICRVNQSYLYHDYIVLKINDIVNAIISSYIASDEEGINEYAKKMKKDIEEVINEYTKDKKKVMKEVINEYAKDIKEAMEKDKILKVSDNDEGELVPIEECGVKKLNVEEADDRYKLYCYSMYILAKSRFKINDNGKGTFVNPGFIPLKNIYSDNVFPFYNISEMLSEWSSNIELSCVKCSDFDFNNCKEKVLSVSYNVYYLNKYNNVRFKTQYRDCNYKECTIETIDNKRILVNIFHTASVNLFYKNYTFLENEIKSNGKKTTNTILIYDTLINYYNATFEKCKNKQKN